MNCIRSTCWHGLLIFGFLCPRVALAEPFPKFGTVSTESIQAWQAFRAAQPLQTQVVALSPPTATKPGTLLITEPPDSFSWKSVPGRLGNLVSGCMVQKKSLMAGGWVYDIVCTLLADPENSLPDRLAAFGRELYGTSEGWAPVFLPAPDRQLIGSSLDLRYGASDLVRWLSEVKGGFRSNAIAPLVSVEDIISGRVSGVYFSGDRELVLWSLPRGVPLDGLESDIRRFAIGSDAVLGAVGNRTALTIVGRGRVESLSHVPPLRAETVLMLAASKETHLAQSYERTHVLSGKGSDGIDRAPILLSRQLVDTELGTLLNVADQLLKGWSEAGTVRYLNFAYPKPDAFPFGATPASMVERKKKRPSFLFNWNTDGIAYKQTISGNEVLVPQRTGALSVIYGDPLDRPRDLENRAYEYFASRGDATLFRVVQYTLLYQIFRQFDISARERPASVRFQRFQKNKIAFTERQLHYLLVGAPNEEVIKALANYWFVNVARIDDAFLIANKRTRKAVYENRLMQAVMVLRALRDAQQTSKGELLPALVKLLTFERGPEAPSSRQIDELKKAFDVVAVATSEEFANEVQDKPSDTFTSTGLMAVAADKLGTWRVLGDDGSDLPSWNHTAYVVASQGAAVVIGGHNIDAPIIQFREDASLSRGQILVEKGADGDMTVVHAPGDSSRVGTLAREVGTRKALDTETIQKDVTSMLRTANDMPPVGLASLRKSVQVIAAKEGEFSLEKAGLAGFKTRPVSATEQGMLASLEQTKHETVVFERLANGSYVLIRTGSADAIEVASIIQATDVLANGLLVSAGGRAPVTVLVRGIPSDKAEAMLTQLKTNLAHYPKTEVDHVLAIDADSAMLLRRPALINTKFTHNGIRIDTGAVKVEAVTSGEFAGFSRVEVPLFVEAKQPFYIRLIFYVKNLARATQEKLLARVSTVLATMKGSASVADINMILKQQLKGDFEQLHVDSMIIRHDSDPTRKLHDVLIVVDEPRVLAAG